MTMATTDLCPYDSLSEEIIETLISQTKLPFSECLVEHIRLLIKKTQFEVGRPGI
jgi:hypothetical protein